MFQGDISKESRWKWEVNKEERTQGTKTKKNMIMVRNTQLSLLTVLSLFHSFWHSLHKLKTGQEMERNGDFCSKLSHVSVWMRVCVCVSGEEWWNGEMAVLFFRSGAETQHASLSETLQFISGRASAFSLHMKGTWPDAIRFYGRLKKALRAVCEGCLFAEGEISRRQHTCASGK